ncbi:hypothetical protein [Ruminococcus sp.]|jgi:hypothetical protein|uniref:hypothetical protein n=1 Tax=Ruminococcus sp. TaxID=41978 RepID=UPI0025F01BF8|nr:hypothetical protein [Ruminococcus sp.]
MRSLSQLAFKQFKSICNKIGIEKIKEYALEYNLFGGKAKLPKSKIGIEIIYKKRYSSAFNTFVEKELKKIGYMDIDDFLSVNVGDVNKANTVLEKEQISNEVSYLSEIIESLKELGGSAHLSEINAKILERNKLPYIKTNQNWQRQVSNSL